MLQLEKLGEYVSIFLKLYINICIERERLTDKKYRSSIFGFSFPLTVNEVVVCSSVIDHSSILFSLGEGFLTYGACTFLSGIEQNF